MRDVSITPYGISIGGADQAVGRPANMPSRPLFLQNFCTTFIVVWRRVS